MGRKCNHKCPHKKEVDGDRTIDRKIGNMIEAKCYPASFEDGGKGQGTMNARDGSSRRWRRPGNVFF